MEQVNSNCGGLSYQEQIFPGLVIINLPDVRQVCVSENK